VSTRAHSNILLHNDITYVGTEIKVAEGEVWAILLITPIMKRTHAIQEAKEMIFCDTSSSCDSDSSSVTVISLASKAGAIPMAALLHSDLTEESYSTAFGLLKQHYPTCFGGNTVRLFHSPNFFN